jgi:hypothetical protein
MYSGKIAVPPGGGGLRTWKQISSKFTWPKNSKNLSQDLYAFSVNRSVPKYITYAWFLKPSPSNSWNAVARNQLLENEIA